jgi:hypothetical protein
MKGSAQDELTEEEKRTLFNIMIFNAVVRNTSYIKTDLLNKLDDETYVLFYKLLQKEFNKLFQNLNDHLQKMTSLDPLQ